MNLNWPREKGHEHYAKLFSDANSVCFLATTGKEVIGYLAGYVWDGGDLQPLKMADIGYNLPETF